MERQTWDTAAPAYTADGVLITRGLAVWTNNMTAVRVVCPERYSPGWFETSDSGMFDGSRMSTRHPVSRELAEAAL